MIAKVKIYFLLTFITIVTLIALLVVFSDVSKILASEELIKNGGFETGSFDGWNVDQACEVTSELAHSGKYSAIIGGPLKEGILSQTIFIPKNSKLIISLWYIVQKGASLDFYLIKTQGGIIKHWSFHEETDWKHFIYELGEEYSEDFIILKFKGIGYSESKKTIVPVTDWIGETLRIEIHYFYSYYYPFIDDVSAWIYRLEKKETTTNKYETFITNYTTLAVNLPERVKGIWIDYPLLCTLIILIVVITTAILVYRFKLKRKPTMAQPTKSLEHKTCKYCGKELPIDAMFCSECGKKQE